MTGNVTLDTRSLPPAPSDGDLAGRLEASEERERWLLEHFQALSEYLLVEQEEERRQLSRILHDRVGQSLTAAIINLQTLLMSGPETDSEMLNLTCRTLSECLTEVREMELNLRPSQLDELGLKLAVEAYLQRALNGDSQVYDFIATRLEERLDPQLETTAFRIIQDLIKLLRRQPGGFHLDILLSRTAESLTIKLDYELGPGDPGDAGIEDKKLLGIRERTALLMGESRVKIQEKAGQIEIELPLGASGNA